jgi:spectinomycin phosphotransferase
MLEKPPIDDNKIIDALRQHYGVTVTELEFLPIGYDPNAGVYRVIAGESAYFLKVKRDDVYELSITIPRYLKAQGIEQVVAPLPTITPDLWAQVDNFALLLYPFVEGEVGMDVGLSDSQWIEFGKVLKWLHDTHLTPRLMAQIRKETFTPQARQTSIIQQLHEDVQTVRYNNPIRQDFAAFWNEKRNTITMIVDRAIQLGEALQKTALEFVLCHADIHTANVLVAPDGKLHIVDWDQPIYAPKERDLMFVIGGTVGRFIIGESQELFLRGYGQTQINLLALVYYRYEWLVQDLAEFGKSIFFDDVGDETKADAARLVKLMFEPGNLVESARELDHVLT